MFLKIVYLTVSFVYVAVGQLVEDDFCTYEKTNEQGICVNILKCPEALKSLKRGENPQRCGFKGLEVIACCPQSRPPGEISVQKCIEYSQYVWTKETNPLLIVSVDEIVRHECPFNREELIVGGKIATRREFPHMVHIGYDIGDNETEWACGGSLISEQFVLTAAHCLDSVRFQQAKFVRMGITNQDDDDHIQKFDVIERIPYPEYHPKYHNHDIALIKLNGTAKLNTWVRPACLYNYNSSPKSNVLASGWGDLFSGGDKSIVLRKVVLELYGVNDCNKYFVKNKKLLNGINDDTMICAGSSTGDRDTCQGDSGGPLQLYKENGKNMSCMYDLIGVTSYGVVCAIAPDVPSVYTRVSYYVKWIEDIVWPPDETNENVSDHQTIEKKCNT